MAKIPQQFERSVCIDTKSVSSKALSGLSLQKLF